jgi:two-component system response regulator ResD
MTNNDTKVLVVDGCRMNSLLLRYVLSQENVPSDAASTGPEALAKAIDGEYGLIFMDIILPEMDGIEVARHLMQYDFEVPPRIVFMTGIGESFDVNAIEDSDTIDVLLKPIAPSSVISFVRAMVDQPTTV